MNALETVIEELKALPPEGLDRAAEYVRQLRENAAVERRGVLAVTAGCLSGEVGASLAEAIDEGCERIDGREW